jgi:hypothetical protein
VAQLYPRALCSLSVASYDSQGSGGGILTRLHTGFPIFKLQLAVTRIYLTATNLFDINIFFHFFSFQTPWDVQQYNYRISSGSCPSRRRTRDCINGSFVSLRNFYLWDEDEEVAVVVMYQMFLEFIYPSSKLFVIEVLNMKNC